MTNNFKQECKNPAYKNRLGKIELDNETISNSDYLSSIEITDSCISNGTVIGNTNAKTIKFNALKNDELINKEINPFIGVKYTDSSEEYIRMGKYTITGETNDKTAKNGEYTGVDNLNKLDQIYVCNIQDLDNATVLDFYHDVCNQIGLTPKQNTFINQDIVVGGNPFTKNETCRVVLQNVAQVFCTFADIDWENNEIDLIWFDDEYTETLEKSDYATLEKNQVYGPINSVVIKDSVIDGENVVIEQNDKHIAITKEGKVEQHSYSGKNLFDYKSASNVNNTGVSTYRLFEINGLKPNTQYNINRMGFTQNLENQYAYIWTETDYSSATNTKTRLATPSYYAEKVDFVSNSNGVVYLAIYPTSVSTWNSVITYFKNAQIEEGSSETSYEPYVGGTPSPNPDYPQEIKSVSGIENLFDINATPIFNVSNNTIATPIENGVRVAIKNNSSGNYAVIYKLIDASNYVGKKFTIKMDFVSSVSNKARYMIGLCDENGENRKASTAIDISGTSYTYTIPTITTSKYLCVWLYSNKSGTATAGDYVDYTNIQVQMSDTIHTPVPYGHWLPIKVENKNIFDINGNINVYGKNGSQKTYNSVSNGILTTTVNNQSAHDTGQKFTNLNGKTITFSAEIVSVGSSSDTTPQTRISIYDNGTQRVKVAGVVGDRISITYTCTSDNIVCGFATLNGTGGQYKNIQVEINNEETDYVEHQEQTTLIDLNKENLFDKNSQITLDKSYTTTGGTTRSTGSFIQESYISVTPNTIYTISTEVISSIFRICEYANDKTFIVRQAINNTSSFTFTTNSTTYYIRISGISENIDTMQLVKGSSPTPYYEICSIGNTKDLLTIKDGKAVLNKNINNIVLNGSESDWRINTNNNKAIHYRQISGKNTGIGTMLSNYFKYNVVLNWQRIANGEMTGQSNSNYIFIRYDEITNIDSFKTWLSTHNTNVYYVLATPETITLRGAYDINLYEGVNYISIEDALDNTIIVETDYLGDKETFTGEYITVENEVHELNEISIDDNYFLYTEALRRQAIENIWEKIKGFTYVDCKVTSYTGKPYLKRGNKLKIQDDDKTYFDTYVLQHTFTYDGTFKSIIESPSLTKTQTALKNTKSISSYFRKVERVCNKLDGKIEDNIQTVRDVNDDLHDHYYTITETNSLVQNSATGVTNTFSKAGGNNIFRNTGLWFETDDENNPFEFWTGKVVKFKEDKSSNMTALKLQNTTLYQEQFVPNGEYTVSFKYKKLINLANVKVKINDVEYTLTETSDTEFVTGEQNINGDYITQPLIVSSQHINVQFISDTADSCEIYDIMVNAGSVKLAYSQNQNETTTDTVNISKGITITSSNTNTVFKADSDGIRIYDEKSSSDKPITQFTDTGITTKRAVIEEESQIVGLLVQQVGSQTWFTRL